MSASLDRRLAAEFLGTGFLLLGVVGSGVMAERLAGGNEGLALLANALATGGLLLSLILTFGGVSGAHFNPVVSLSMAGRGLPWREVAPYVLAQVMGAFAGVAAAHAMFALPLRASTHVRSGAPLLLSEGVATLGLLLTIHGVGRYHPASVPSAVAAYIVGAYWATASTSFANPAVTLARCVTDTFAGIRPTDAPGFVLAQLGGLIVAVIVARWMFEPS